MSLNNYYIVNTEIFGGFSIYFDYLVLFYKKRTRSSGLSAMMDKVADVVEAWWHF